VQGPDRQRDVFRNRRQEAAFVTGNGVSGHTESLRQFALSETEEEPLFSKLPAGQLRLGYPREHRRSRRLKPKGNNGQDLAMPRRNALPCCLTFVPSNAAFAEFVGAIWQDVDGFQKAFDDLKAVVQIRFGRRFEFVECRVSKKALFVQKVRLRFGQKVCRNEAIDPRLEVWTFYTAINTDRFDNSAQSSTC